MWPCGVESCKFVLLLTSLTALAKFLRPHSHSCFIFKLRILIPSIGCCGEWRWWRQAHECLSVSVSFSSHLTSRLIEVGARGKLRPFNSVHGFLEKKVQRDMTIQNNISFYNLTDASSWLLIALLLTECILGIHCLGIFLFLTLTQEP